MLEVVALTKRYSAIPAVQDVSFKIRRGQILGYLGPNGSGKSTAVKMLTGLIEPTAGKIVFDGLTIHGGDPFFARDLGYVPEEPHIYSHLTGAEYLRLVGRLHFIPESAVGAENQCLHRAVLTARRALRVAAELFQRHAPENSVVRCALEQSRCTHSR